MAETIISPFSPITHPDVLDTTKWSENGNQLGEILMELRDELKS